MTPRNSLLLRVFSSKMIRPVTGLMTRSISSKATFGFEMTHKENVSITESNYIISMKFDDVFND